MFAGAAILGTAMGMADLVAKSFPAYLTGDLDELKRINSAVYTVSNVAVIVGPLLGGTLAAALSTSSVFLLLGICALVSVVPALGFRPVRSAATPDDAEEASPGLGRGFRTVFSTPASGRASSRSLAMAPLTRLSRSTTATSSTWAWSGWGGSPPRREWAAWWGRSSRCGSPPVTPT